HDRSVRRRRNIRGAAWRGLAGALGSAALRAHTHFCDERDRRSGGRIVATAASFAAGKLLRRRYRAGPVRRRGGAEECSGMTTARIPLLHRYANPAAFGRLSAQILPGLGLYFGLFASPPDYQQGNSVRIMYVHVPAAIMSEIVYGLMAAAAAAGFIWKHALADLFVKAAAPLGAAFTFVCLVAGSLWGKPMWGAWWVWDARLTSVLILFFLYLGHIALVRAFDDVQRGYRAGGILALVGVVNLPIIKFSVDWWT